MPTIQGKTALVTGASSGIGKSTVQMFLDEGATVYAAARRIGKMEDLAESGARILSLDVCSDDSIMNCVSTITEAEGSIDILVNNAGYGSYGALEDVSIDEARRQFEVNIFGLARLIQLVLPRMRENHYGKIVNISSVGGKIYTPFGAWYHATKHALEGLTDSLRLEVSEFGIDPIIIEPGGIATDWGIIAAENLDKTSGKGAYMKQARQSAKNMAEMYSGHRLSPASVIGKTILKAVKAKRPKTRYPAGGMAGLLLLIRSILSDRAFDSFAKKMMW